MSNGWNVVFDSNKVIEIEEDLPDSPDSPTVENSPELEGMDLFVSAKELFGESMRVDKPVCAVLPSLLAEIEKYEEDCVGTIR